MDTHSKRGKKSDSDSWKCIRVLILLIIYQNYIQSKEPNLIY